MFRRATTASLSFPVPASAAATASFAAQSTLQQTNSIPLLRQVQVRAYNPGKFLLSSPYGPQRNSQFGWTGGAAGQKGAAAAADLPAVRCYLDKEAPQVFIGTSSLNCVPSKGSARAMPVLMEQYRTKFNILEHCYPYHNMADIEHWEKWERMPGSANPDFLFTVKANKYLTHLKRLTSDEDTLRHVFEFFHDRCAALKGRLGAVLVQLPPSFARNPENLIRIKKLAAAIPPQINIAVEFRHTSWWNEETYEVLRSLKTWSLVATHNEDTGETPVVDTGSNILYVRLHGRRYMEDYGPATMQRWAEEIYNFVSKDPVNRKVFFFLNNNESHVANVTSSVVDASCLTMKLKALLEARGGFEGSRKKMPSKKHQIPVLSQKAEDSLVASAVAKQKILKGIKSAKIAPVAVRKVGRPAKVILERSEPWLQVAVSLKAKRGPKAKKVGKK